MKREARLIYALSQGFKANETHTHHATKFRDIITADYKILNEEGESRNNQRYAIVVQNGFKVTHAQQKLHKKR